MRNEDGSPREIDDFLPRARVKKLFTMGELHSSDKPKLTELSKELAVPVNLLEECVKHCEQLKLLGDMRAKKRRQDKVQRDAKVYEDYNWKDHIQSGTLKKLTVKELDKYMDHHHLPRKYLSKDGKVQAIVEHYYRARGKEGNPLESPESEDEWITESEMESDDGEDTILTEIGEDEIEDEEEEEAERNELEEKTRSGRRITRRADSEWLFY